MKESPEMFEGWGEVGKGATDHRGGDLRKRDAMVRARSAQRAEEEENGEKEKRRRTVGERRERRRRRESSLQYRAKDEVLNNNSGEK